MRLFQRRFWLILAMPFILAACEGGGVKGSDEISRAIQNADANTVFVYRDTGYAGSANLMIIHVDGKPVGNIGIQESFDFKVPRGTHRIEIKYSGLAVLMETGKATFTNDGKQPHFFVVSQKQSFVGGKIILVETTASSYASVVR